MKLVNNIDSIWEVLKAPSKIEELKYVLRHCQFYKDKSTRKPNFGKYFCAVHGKKTANNKMY